MVKIDQVIPVTKTKTPKFVKTDKWEGYDSPIWKKEDKHKVTILCSMIERRKSYYLHAYFERNGYNYYDMGDHIKEDVRWGREYGNRMQCNPLYFTSGALIRTLDKIHRETGLTKDEVVEKYIFLGGGGQCGPCRYGMYPQEYMKAANDAGFKNMRILIFSSDVLQGPQPKGSAFRFSVNFKINAALSIALADMFHIAECAFRPGYKDKEALMKVITEAEEIVYKDYASKLWLFKLPRALKKAGRLLQSLEKNTSKRPLIYVTGENFANYAHNEGNYNLRRFIMDEDCEVIPGIFSQRVLYDNWRRIKEGEQNIRFAKNKKDAKFWKSYIRRQNTAITIIDWIYTKVCKWIEIDKISNRWELDDINEFANLARDYYDPEIFGGEGFLEVGEALYYADQIDGLISSKPFGCMPSSGVSDGVMTRVLAKHPSLNFLSIETSGDNEVSILSRVSMLLFKAKQKMVAKQDKENELKAKQDKEKAHKSESIKEDDDQEIKEKAS